MKTLISAFALSLILPAAAVGGETKTINLYNARDSKNAGYARIDERTGRVDIYDARSHRTSYGRVAPGGKSVDLYRSSNSERILTGKPAVPSGTGTRSNTP
jgi:hypothetical protein